MGQVIFRKHENPDPEVAEEFFAINIRIFRQQLMEVAWIQANYLRPDSMFVLKRLDQTHDVAKHASPPWFVRDDAITYLFQPGQQTL
jgi:hypothetical protein